MRNADPFESHCKMEDTYAIRDGLTFTVYSPETADPSDECRGGPRDSDPLLWDDELVHIVVLLGARFNVTLYCSILPFSVSFPFTDISQ